jgi:hypothetical protein
VSAASSGRTAASAAASATPANDRMP